VKTEISPKEMIDGLPFINADEFLKQNFN